MDLPNLFFCFNGGDFVLVKLPLEEGRDAGTLINYVDLVTKKEIGKEQRIFLL